jgi:hypothetical protein
MKKLALATLLVASTSFVHAEYKFVNSDNTPLTELCIAAIASPATLHDSAEKLGLSPTELDSVLCNKTPLKRFALKYSKPSVATATVKTSGYLLTKADASPLTELCAAAAISDKEYTKVKDLHFKDEALLESELKCNGRSLKSFVRKFREVGVVTTQVSSR